MVHEPDNSIDTLSKTLSLTQLQSSSDMTHSNARALSGDDLFLDGWNESYVVQSSVWNNSDTQLFWITTICERLDCKMVASMLMA
jgi:hypothetical protein